MNRTNSASPLKSPRSLDWTAGTLTIGSSLLGLYALKAASDAKNTPTMLFHLTIGLYSFKHAWGFRTAWGENKAKTTNGEFLSNALSHVKNIENSSIEIVSDFVIYLIKPSKKA